MLVTAAVVIAMFLVVLAIAGVYLNTYKITALGYVTPGASGTGALNHGTITVSATGSASTVPSQGQISLWVNGSGATTQAATANLSSTMQLINASVQPYINGNTSMISTQSYNVYKAYNKSSYVATESIAITVPNAANLGAALSALSAIPNTYVTSAQATLSSSQMTALRNTALASALANASSQASVLSMGAPLTAWNITETSYYSYPFPVFSTAAATPSNPTIFGGRQSVTASLRVVYYRG